MEEFSSKRFEKALSLKAINIEGVDLERISVEDVLRHLRCSRDGLANHEAGKRLDLFGWNKVQEKNTEYKLLKFFRFMWNPYTCVLGFTGIVAIAVASGDGKAPEWQEAVGIVALLLVNTVISFIEEDRAGTAAAALMRGITPSAKVLRDKKWTRVEAQKLVPGDIINLRMGDIVPADARLLEGNVVKIDQSALTGESMAATKFPGEGVYSGSVCTQGEIQAVVIATGAQTFSHKARQVVNDTTHHSVGHFDKVLSMVGNFCIGFIVAGMVVEIMVMYPVQHRSFRDGIKNLLVLLIGGNPIVLPTLLSITMSTSSRRLSQLGAITKRMTAIEGMARMDVLCIDKTGTLSLNDLAIDKALMEVFPSNMTKDEVLVLAARASSTDVDDQDAIDACIIRTLADPSDARNHIQELLFVPFNPVDKMCSLTYFDSRGKLWRACKGAPEKILELINDNEDLCSRVHCTVDRFAERGFRSLAVAVQELPVNPSLAEGGSWNFCGLLPLFDPPTHDSAETLRCTRELGIRIKMITGDQVAIGKEMARRLGMGTNIYPSSALLQHDKSDSAVCDRAMNDLIEAADGFAGLYPEHKHEIVSLLQERKHVVGMTGDGVNDAPALAQADIGIAVGNATDAARSASDIILTEPGLTAIISAVLISRVIFQKMKTYTIYAISTTVATVLGFSLLALLWKFDFSPFMMMIVAISNDGTMIALAKGRAKPSAKPDRRRPREMFAIGVFLGFYLGVMTVFFFWVIHDTDYFSKEFRVQPLKFDKGKLTSAVFLQVSIGSQALVFVTRSQNWSLLDSPGFLLLGAFGCVESTATLLTVYANWAFADLKGIGWKWAAIVWVYSLIIFLPLDVIKISMRRSLATSSNQSPKTPVPELDSKPSSNKLVSRDGSSRSVYAFRG